MKLILVATSIALLYACSVPKKSAERQPQQAIGEIGDSAIEQVKAGYNEGFNLTAQNYDSIYEIPKNLDAVMIGISGVGIFTPYLGSFETSDCLLQFFRDDALIQEKKFKMHKYYSKSVILELKPGVLKTKLKCSNGGSINIMIVPEENAGKALAEMLFKPADKKLTGNRRNEYMISSEKAFEIEKTVLMK